MRYEFREGYACNHRMVFAPIHLPPMNPHCRVFRRPQHYDSNYELIPEVEQWLKENVEPAHNWRRGYFVCQDYNSMLVSFAHKADAMKFKLTWS